VVSWVGKWKRSIESRREMEREEMEEAGMGSFRERSSWDGWKMREEDEGNYQICGRRVEGIKE
jgi:hypothetical protein